MTCPTVTELEISNAFKRRSLAFDLPNTPSSASAEGVQDPAVVAVSDEVPVRCTSSTLLSSCLMRGEDDRSPSKFTCGASGVMDLIRAPT